MPRPVLVSGIQPSGQLHIGNYLGALKNFVELQNSNKYECFFFIADLHSLTEEFEPRKKEGQILELTADYLAAGLDPKKSTIFLQSLIPAHAELAWILDTITPMGELSRMTQFKEKTAPSFTYKLFREEIKQGAKNSSENINVGLFNYPVLMAADIILYDAKFVPVGEDQLQHLELTRTLVRKFNNQFGQTFVEPKPILTKAPRIMSLGDPTKKMSKSKPNTCLFLDDSEEEIIKKIKKAVTDSGSEIRYNPDKKPAISNLLSIYASFSEKEVKVIEKDYAEKSYSDLKKDLAKLVTEKLSNFQKEKKNLISKPKTLKSTLEEGSRKANQIAEKKFDEVKHRLGLKI